MSDARLAVYVILGLLATAALVFLLNKSSWGRSTPYSPADSAPEELVPLR